MNTTQHQTPYPLSDVNAYCWLLSAVSINSGLTRCFNGRFWRFGRRTAYFTSMLLYDTLLFNWLCRALSAVCATSVSAQSLAWWYAIDPPGGELQPPHCRRSAGQTHNWVPTGAQVIQPLLLVAVTSHDIIESGRICVQAVIMCMRVC